MIDLISRAYILAEYDSQHKGPPGGARKIMEEAPAVDAAPVVHARWIYEHGDPAMLPCSACGYEVYRYNNTPYCPNCGAKMDATGMVKGITFADHGETTTETKEE